MDFYCSGVFKDRTPNALELSFALSIVGAKSMIFAARQFEFRFPRPILLMGILNVTPDSFSDGGRFFNEEAAVAHALKLVDEGADIIDVGGESTRPNAEPVSEEEELRRVLPIIRKLARRMPVPISIDTLKPAVARAAVEAGAAIINDIAANREDGEMWKTVAESGSGYVVMHMKGTPQTMQQRPEYADVTADIQRFFEDRLNRLKAAGVRAEQTVLDVGIGFGKTAEHNLQLMGQLRSFTRWRRPLLLGVSRKSFIGQLTGANVAERLPGSLACACLAAAEGAGIIRTHDVAETKQALIVAEAILARKKHVGTDTE
jgi:dihydropteroate synthase